MDYLAVTMVLGLLRLRLDLLSLLRLWWWMCMVRCLIIKLDQAKLYCQFI